MYHQYFINNPIQKPGESHTKPCEASEMGKKIDNLKGYKRQAIAFGNFSYILSRVESGCRQGGVAVESGWSRGGAGGESGGEVGELVGRGGTGHQGAVYIHKLPINRRAAGCYISNALGIALHCNAMQKNPNRRRER